MTVKTAAFLGLRLAALTVLLFMLWSLTGVMLGLGESQSSADEAAAAGALLGVCALHAIVLSLPIVRSRWFGWRLAIAIFLVYFGIGTFLAQIETIAFLEHLVEIVPAELIPKFFLQGALVAMLFSPIAVLMHRKFNRREPLQRRGLPPEVSKSQWLWKAPVIAIIYVFIYYAFGALVFIPLAGAAFDEYYAGLQMPWWMPVLQVGRALVWTAIAVLVMQMLQRSWKESGLIVALLFSVIMASMLLIPNPFMPAVIRQAHFIELLSSNFVFGWVVVWILSRQTQTRPEASARHA